jgi:hypothetical protein
MLLHRYGQHFDYIFAIAWLFYDISRSNRRALRVVITLNAIVFITSICIKYNSDYWLYHSLWHLLSAAKCLYISKIITYYRVAGVSSSPYRA